MTAVVLAVVLIVGCTVGLGVVIWLVGTFATVGVRLEHQREMVRLGEEQKLNALTIRERDTAVTERQMGMIEAATVVPPPNRNPDSGWS